MADSDVILKIKVLADASAAAAGLDKAGQSSSKFARGLQKAALPAAAAGVAIIALGKKALNSASDLQQAQGAVEAVFGKQADAVKKNADAAAKTMGLSAAQYNQYAALVGTALQNAGFSVEQSVSESNKVMQRGADLSALYGGTTADAVEAINAAVSRSEFDPLEKYGVTLNQTAINAELAAKGQDKLTGAALNTAKKQAILEQVYKQSSKAAGQYARESDSAAGAQQTMAAQVENASAALGQILLPIVASMSGALGDMATWTQKNATTVQVLVGVIAGLAATILVLNGILKTAAVLQGAYNGVMLLGSKAALGTRIQVAALTVAETAQAAAVKAVAIATKGWALATKLLSAAWAASPIGVVVLIIVAIAAALYLAYRRSATFRAFVQGMWAGISAAARATWQVIKTVWDAILNAGKAAFNWLKANWQYALAGVLMGPFGVAIVYIVKNFDKVKKVVRAVFNAIKAAARVVGTALRTIFRSAFSAIASVVRAYIGVVRNVLNTVKTAARGVASYVKNALGAAWRYVVTVARNQIALVRNALGGIKDAAASVASYVRDKLAPIWGTLKSKAVSALNAIKSPLDTIKSAFDSLIGKVQSLISWLGKIKIPKLPGSGLLSKLTSRVSASAAPATPTTRGLLGMNAPRVAAPVALGASSGPVVINVNVTGALDPEAVARQLQRVLAGHDRRIGLRTA